jgi:hypothetical protein
MGSGPVGGICLYGVFSADLGLPAGTGRCDRNVWILHRCASPGRFEPIADGLAHSSHIE